LSFFPSDFDKCFACAIWMWKIESYHWVVKEMESISGVCRCFMYMMSPYYEVDLKWIITF